MPVLQNGEAPSVNPEMLVLARESRGLTQVDLAGRIEATQGRVSKVETGVLPVPPELLHKYVEVLGYPQSFFQQPGPAYSYGTDDFYHRRRQSMPQRSLRMLHAQLNVRRLHIQNLLRSIELNEISIPRLDIDEYDGDAARVAQLIRMLWSLPPGPIPRMVRLLESVGAIIVKMNFDTKLVDATSIWPSDARPLIFINDILPTDRLRYTLAHELGHLVMHSMPHPDAENQANQFAAEFLMPATDIRSSLTPDITLSKLSVLKEQWRVSMAALLKRGEDLGRVPGNRARRLWMQMSAAGYKQVEPLSISAEDEPSVLDRIIEVHLGDLHYSTDDLALLLSLTPSEFGELYQLPRTPRLRLVR